MTEASTPYIAIDAEKTLPAEGLLEVCPEVVRAPLPLLNPHLVEVTTTEIAPEPTQEVAPTPAFTPANMPKKRVPAQFEPPVEKNEEKPVSKVMTEEQTRVVEAATIIKQPTLEELMAYDRRLLIASMAGDIKVTSSELFMDLYGLPIHEYGSSGPLATEFAGSIGRIVEAKGLTPIERGSYERNTGNILEGLQICYGKKRGTHTVSLQAEVDTPELTRKLKAAGIWRPKRPTI